MQIGAVDEDDGPLEYIVIPNANNPLDGSAKFLIDPDTGEIRVKSVPLDRENVPEYHLDIEVSDGEHTGKNLPPSQMPPPSCPTPL